MPPIFYMNDSVTINGLIWKIIYTNNGSDLAMPDGTRRLGVCDKNKLTIYIYDKLSYNMLKDVMIHELTHAYIFSYDYYLTEKEEEFVCEFVAKYSEGIVYDAYSLIDIMFKTFKKIF